MRQLSMSIGSGTTAEEAADKARIDFNNIDGNKSIVRIETVFGSDRFTTVIWFDQTSETMTIPAKKTQHFIGMPVGTDPLNPAHN